MLSIATFGPTLSAPITHRIYAGLGGSLASGQRCQSLRLELLLEAAFTAAFFITESGIGRWEWSSLEQILILFLPNLLSGPLGEEGGWRGYALPRLQRLIRLKYYSFSEM